VLKKKKKTSPYTIMQKEKVKESERGSIPITYIYMTWCETGKRNRMTW